MTNGWSSSSFGENSPNIFRARIEAIDDPKGRNRCAIRLFGYQDNQGNIPKDQLEWCHALSHDAQIPGATSTHNYYPGSEVLVLDNGTEKFILGSTPGFDGEKRLAQNPWGIDTSENTNADVPNINRSQKSETTVRGQGQGIVGPKGNPVGANQYFNFASWASNIVNKMFAYSTGKGAIPAPFGTGTITKSDALKTIGLQKHVNGSDILNIIQALDGNASGSIKTAIQLILNLRNNGFGNAMSMIGSGTFNSALNQYATQYGSTTQNDLVNLLQNLLAQISIVQGFQDVNFYNNVVNNSALINIIALLSNITFNIASTIIQDMQSINNNVTLSAGNAPLSYYGAQLTQFQSDFSTAVNQGFTSILNQLNQLMATVNFDIGTFILMFGGTQNFIQFAQIVLQIANYISIPQTALSTVANNVIGLAIGGGLPQIIPTFNVQPTNPSNSLSSAPNMLIGLLAIFKGNPIATAEMLGGQLVKKFMSGNPVKYKSNPRNDGQGVLKKFQDDPAPSGTSVA